MTSHRILVALIATSMSALLAACGDSGGGSGTAEQGSTSWVRHWNHIAIDASGLDHTPVAPGENRVFGEQVGPGRSSRAMAIVHVAIFDALIAVKGGYESYTGLPREKAATSLKAAIAQAAHDTLAALFPSQRATFDTELGKDLAKIAEGRPKTRGIDLGRRAAAAILALRANDGSAHAEPRYGVDYVPSGAVGEWSQDPISRHPLALGARWAEVTPFALTSASQFRIPPPPALDSPEYAASFQEVQSLGGDDVTTPTVRTADETRAGVYWAYDGTPSLCAPPRLYNQIALQIALEQGADIVELARVLALVNVAMADAGIAAWESKYYYKLWRPVTGIRAADLDGNPDTVADLTYAPLGAPASNLTGPNFTPPFPAYPSGHATFGGALFQVLRRIYGDDVPFTFVSDEFNGTTLDNAGAVRPLVPRSFDTLSEAEEENGQSRIYLGIHWSFDKTEGIAQGHDVGNFVVDHIFQPKRR